MKIAILGYGRMGKTIESYSNYRKHEVVFILDKDHEKGDLSLADVAINFSVPEAAVSNIKLAMTHKIPVVCGTTGWLDNYKEVVSFCETQKTAFIYASNFSIGVNIFFKINRIVAQLMHPHEKEYKTDIKEIHHVHKLDSPSGTAITLAEGIINNSDHESWTLNQNEETSLFIKAIRKGEIPGTHKISYRSNIDEISIKHKAYKRDGFALGAIIAAEWLLDKKGVYTMDDILKID
ncbi:MAG: 4-hydroxy-tetrahydrodipicolinate reductase [Flavobacteriaceae bacterium TMED179]|nr:MAG: 4-hydroxy-tetrahydrodipicolinate reductase [Flavobacteriaceae bacterium TMED179]|tara:strand:+ start:4464 stop:5168 length:705 start_codon:yes stop_codon:yes gene_type:complete